MSNCINDVSEYIKNKGYNVFSVAVFEDGYDEPQSAILQPSNPCQNAYSVAKVFTMTAIGMLYDRKLLSLNSRAVDLLGEECPEKLHEYWKSVTLEMLLMHRAGLEGGCLDIDCLDSREFGEDYLDYLMHLPFKYKPGTDEYYSDGAYYLLARTVEHITKENLTSFLWHELFYKLGFTEIAWSCCPKGHAMGATGLYIKAHDMVKLGKVYLDKGLYNGQRIVSEEWVNIALSKPFELSETGIGNVYGKGGMHCQKLFVDPDKKRAVALLGYDNTDIEDIIRFISDY